MLEDPEIGDFTVKTLLNEQHDTIKVQIDKFFAKRKPDDLLLLYFSCHGIRDPSGQLHLVAHDTDTELLDSTGISGQWVKEQMDHSRSQRIVLLLDCCYSGALTRSLGHRSPSAKEIPEELAGHGRIVITASRKTQFAYESKFTDAVVQGLETGAADLDGDGQVSAYELYQYVYDQVRRRTQDQTPTISVDGMRGQLYLARNPHVPLPLPAVIEQVLKRPKGIRERLWVIESLRHLLADDHPGGLKLTARKALDQLCERDASLLVRKAASKALRSVPGGNGSPTHIYRWVAIFLVAALAATVGWRLLPAEEPFTCSPSTKAADGVLSLGTLLPRTGRFVYTGPALDAGVKLAMKEINDAGAIPGIPVKLDQTNEGDEGNPDEDNTSTSTASRWTDTLLSGGVDAIIGPSTSAVAEKMIDKVTCAGIIMFSPSNTSTLFTTYADHGRYFRTSPSSEIEGSVIGKLVVHDGNRSAVVLSRDDIYGNSLREAIAEEIQRSGGEVLDSFNYDPNARDHKKEIQRIKAKNPDAIVLIGFAETAPILAGMIKEGLGPRDKRLYGAADTSNTLAARVSPRNPGVLAGMKGTSPDAGDDAFVRRLKEKNPGLQDLTYAAEAYDAVVVTALAAAVAGTDEPAAVAAEINGVTKAGEKCTTFAACMALVRDRKDIDYDGPSGPLEFTEPGEPPLATYVISEVQADGTVKPSGGQP